MITIQIKEIVINVKQMPHILARLLLTWYETHKTVVVTCNVHNRQIVVAIALPLTEVNSPIISQEAVI